MSDDGQQFFSAAVDAWMAEPEAIPKLVITNYRLHCENATLTSQLAARDAEVARLREALGQYSDHRLSLITSETANQIRATVGIDLMTKTKAVAALDSMRAFVARTMPPMLESVRKARAALAAPTSVDADQT